jgi:hypothetical protein
MSYSTPLSRWAPNAAGNLTVRALANYVRELVTSDGESTEDYAGLLGNTTSSNFGGPHWRGNLSENYSVGPWSYFLEQRFIGPGRYTDNFTVNNNTIGSVFYLNGSIRYNMNAGGARVQIYAAANNLLNRAPPIVPGNFFEPAQTNPIFYDVIGRTFSIGTRVQF